MQLVAAGTAWLLEKRPAAALPFMATDAAGKSLTAVLVMQILEAIWQDEETGAFFTAYTVLLYNQNSILKFQVTRLFPGMIQNPMERFAGGLLVNLSILVSCKGLQVFHRKICARDREKKKHQRDVETVGRREESAESFKENVSEESREFKIDHQNTIAEGYAAGTAEGKTRNSNPIFSAAITGACLFATLRISSLMTDGRTLTVRSGRVLQTVWNTFLDLLYLLCIAAFLAGRQQNEEIVSGECAVSGELKGYPYKEPQTCPAAQLPWQENRHDENKKDENGQEGKTKKAAGQRKRKAGQRDSKAGPIGFRWNTIKGILPLGIVFIVQLITFLSTGSRQHISELVLYYILAVLVTGDLESKDLETLLYLSPPVLVLLSLISDKTSGRLDPYGKLFPLQYHAFRCDLSDLAFTIASRIPGNSSAWYLQAEGTEGWETILLWIRENLSSHLQSGIQILKEALSMSIPRVITGNSKPEHGLPMYSHSLQSIGLSPQNTDYNDTYFSMGAQILGFAGIFLVFFLILIFQDLLSRLLGFLAVHAAAGKSRSNEKDKEPRIEKYKEQNIEKNNVQETNHLLSPEKAMLILGIPFYARAEGDWFMCFYQIRDFLLSCIFFLVLFRLCSHIHSNRGTKITEKTMDHMKGSRDNSIIISKAG